MARGPSQVSQAGIPAQNWVAIATSNSVAQPDMRAVHCGGNAGTVVAEGQNGTTASFAITAGGFLGIAPAKIYTNSTATGLVAVTD